MPGDLLCVPRSSLGCLSGDCLASTVAVVVMWLLLLF